MPDEDGLYLIEYGPHFQEIVEIRGGRTNTIAYSYTSIIHRMKNQEIWAHYKSFLIEIKDLPLYISWPTLYPRFEELLKGADHGNTEKT